MRPIRLEISGFTAFREPVVVDFEGCDYFALCGPTGAGKSSIIDAMSFALYGCVPRLGEKQVAPVISQGLLEAKVRFDFSVDNEIYTAVRVVRRTKTGATTPEARLQKGDEVLAGNADALTHAVERLLGLRFEHFTKCVVLPQGEFAEFLHAKPGDRQDLLVRLLDLGIYDIMGKRANQIAAAARKHAEYLTRRLEEELSYATIESRDAAAARLTAIESLWAQVEQAQPRNEELLRIEEQFRRDAESAEARSTRLSAVAMPRGLDEQSSRTESARAAHAGALAALTGADAARGAAEDALAAFPDRATLEIARESHRSVAQLNGDLQPVRTVLAHAVAGEADAAKALDEAGEFVKAAQDAQEAARSQHRAHDLARTLTAGDPCPVCRQVVSMLPGEQAPADLMLTDTAATRAVQAFERVRSAHVQIQKERATAEARLSDLDARLAAARAKTADHPDRDLIEATLAHIAAAESALAAARIADRDARRAVEQSASLVSAAESAERGAWQTFDAARDAVSDMSPPSASRQDLIADWKALAHWATERIPTEQATAAAARSQEVAAATQRRALSAGLVEQCRAIGIDPAPKVGQAVMKALADQRSISDRITAALEEIERVRQEQRNADDEHSVAGKLGQHLSAKGFEKWMLDEAIAELLDGASEIMLELSAGAYTLAIDERSNAFTVIDHRQAGERRSAKTLSGGETFLASLALALSLSDRLAQMASEGARLDAIFLDEGFGTLDAETLETVAAAIEGLATRRMVGLVTHVPAIAERVPVRFDVRKGPDTSTVERVEM